MAAKAADPKASKLPALHDDDSGDEDLSRVTEGASEKAIKRACRLGLTNAERGLMWVKLAGATNREEYYHAALEKVFGAGNIKPSKVYRVRASIAGAAARWRRLPISVAQTGRAVALRFHVGPQIPCCCALNPRRRCHWS